MASSAGSDERFFVMSRLRLLSLVPTMPAPENAVPNADIQALVLVLLLAVLAPCTGRASPTELPITKIASLHETRTSTPSRAKFLVRRQCQRKNLPILGEGGGDSIEFLYSIERDSAGAAGYGSGRTASGGGFSSKPLNPTESLATGDALAGAINPGTTASLIPSFWMDGLGSTSGWHDVFGPGREPEVELQPPNVPETLPTPFVVLVLSAVLGLGTRALKTS
jgi:hypothetical protein